MSSLPRKKSYSWHNKSVSKTMNADKKISNLISENNRSIFSEILQSKLSSFSSSIKNHPHIQLKRDILKGVKESIQESSNDIQNKNNFCQGVLNQSFSRFNKCNCCGSSYFYENSKLKTTIHEMMRSSRKKNSFSEEISKLQKFSIHNSTSVHRINTISLKPLPNNQSSSNFKNPNDKEIKENVTIFSTKTPILNENNCEELNNPSNFGISPRQNYFHDYVPQETEIKKAFMNKIFEKQSMSSSQKHSINSQKPIENTIIQAMLSLKKELPMAFTNKTMTRKEILILRKWFSSQEEILNKRSFKSIEEKTNNFFELYSICLSEVIKEISLECAEKGEIINEIWQKFLNLLAGHRVLIDEEIKKLREKTDVFLEKFEKEKIKIIETNQNLIDEKNKQITELRLKNKEILTKTKLLEQNNKTYWEDSNKYRFLCKKINENFLSLKQEYQNLQNKVYLRNQFEDHKKNPEIYVNNQTPENSFSSTPKPDKTNKFNEDIFKYSKNQPINPNELPSLEEIKDSLIENIVGTSETNINAIMPQQMRSILINNENSQKNSINNASLLMPQDKKASLIEKMPSNEQVNQVINQVKQVKYTLPIRKIDKGTQYIDPTAKINTEKTKRKESKDSSMDSRDSFLSNLEICDQEKREHTLIKLKDLNNLITMVHPDKFKISMNDNFCQNERDLFDSWHKSQATQTNTHLLESRFDHIFSSNKEIKEFLNEYAYKKEIENLCQDKNLLDLKKCDNLSSNIEELIEESFRSNDKFNEIKELNLDNSFSPLEKKKSFDLNESNNNEEINLRINLNENEENIAIFEMKKGVEITNTIINSPVLKFKTMTRIREFFLKVLRVYFKENSKNIIFGNEIRTLNEKLKMMTTENECLDRELEEIKKKMENLPYEMYQTNNKNMIDSEFFQDLSLDEEEDDEKEINSSNGTFQRKKKGKSYTMFYRNEEKNEPAKVKSINPGAHLISQINEKNISKFQNVISIKMIYKTIFQVYQDRITLMKENPKIKDIDCPSFLYNFFIKCYGFRKMAQQKFIIFLLSLKKYITQLRINIFSKFLGMLQTSMNYNLEEFNQYISGLDFIFYNSSSPNSENDSRFMVNFGRAWEFVKVTLEKDYENNNSEFYHFKREIEGIKEEDPRNYLKSGIIDYDLFMSHYLMFYRKTRNQNKINLVTAFNSADLNSDGFVDYNEFTLILKYIEKDFFSQKKSEGIEKIFKENADVIILEDEKHMSFNNFCYFSEEFNLFDINKLLEFAEVSSEEQIPNKLVSLSEKWKFKKFEAKSKIEIEQIENKKNWLDSFEKLDKKIEKGLSEEKFAFPCLISLIIFVKKIEDELKI